jgi:hypothetical protein
MAGDSQYAQQPSVRDPLEEIRRSAAQYTTSRATQTLGDYSYKNPQHPFYRPTQPRHIPFPYPSYSSGGFGGGGEGAAATTPSRRKGQMDVYDLFPSEAPPLHPEGQPKPGGENGGNGGEPSGAPPGGGFSPWGTHQPDYNDQMVPKIQGSSVGEPVRVGGPSPYL